MAAPTASVSLNTQKITGLANGTASTDAAAFGQIPTSASSIGGMTTATYDPASINQQVLGTTATQTVSNKRVTKRVATLTDAATVTPDSDNFDGGKLTSLSQTTAIANPTGTPTSFQQYTLRIKSTSSQTLSFGTQYRGSNTVALPTVTTGGGKTDYLGFQWNADDSKWDCWRSAWGISPWQTSSLAPPPVTGMSLGTGLAGVSRARATRRFLRLRLRLVRFPRLPQSQWVR